MGQRPGPIPLILLLLARPALLVLVTVFTGCDRTSPPTASPSSSQPSTGPASPAAAAATRTITVASLSPAATEILIGLGAADRLVAVSNFDPARDETKGLPRVGDYQTTDWERLAGLRPAVMVTQFAADRLPAGLVQKAQSLNVQLVNVPITRLDDIRRAVRTIADAIGDPAAGAALEQQIDRRLDAVRARAVARESAGGAAARRVRALVLIDDEARGVAGPGNYLDDALRVAGGENVMGRGSSPYPAIDREMLFDLDPEVIFQLVPGAAPHVLGRVRRSWETMPNLQAVRNGRVHVLTQRFVLWPTHDIAALAELFAAGLDEVRGTGRAATTMPATGTTPTTAATTMSVVPALMSRPTTMTTRPAVATGGS